MYGFILNMNGVELYRNYICELFKNYDIKFETKVSYLLLSWMINKIYNQSIDINNLKKDKNGKPYLKNSDIKFNISHCADFIVCGVSKNEIGVDIEKTRKFSDSLIKRILVPSEYLNNYSFEDLTTIWCIKEAYSKLLGLGLKLKFNSIAIEYIISNYECVFKNENNIHFCIVSSNKLINLENINIYDIF